MRNTTINVSNLNQDIKNQNEGFLRSMDSIIAVLDSIRQIGENGSSYGLQSDLIELTNDLVHNLAAAMNDSQDWSPTMQKAFLGAVVQKLTGNFEIKDLNGQAYVHDDSVAPNQQLQTLKKAIEDHLTFSLYATAKKHAELAGIDVKKQYDGIVDQVTGKDGKLRADAQVVFTKTEELSKPLQEYYSQIDSVKDVFQADMAPAAQAAIYIQVNGLGTALDVAKRSLEHQINQDVAKVIQAKAATNSKIQSFTHTVVVELQEVKASELEVHKAEEEVGKQLIVVKKLEYALEAAELANKPAIQGQLVIANNTYRDLKQAANSKELLLKDSKQKLSDTTANLKREQQLLERLQKIEGEFTDQKTALSRIETVPQVGDANVNGGILNVDAQKRVVTEIFDLVKEHHKSAVAEIIFQDPLAAEVIDCGKEVFMSAGLFSLKDTKANVDNMAIFEAKAETGIAITGLDELRSGAADVAVEKFCDAIGDRLSHLQTDQTIDASNAALDKVKDDFKRQLAQQLEGAISNLRADLTLKIDEYLKEVVEANTEEEIDALNGKRAVIESLTSTADLKLIKEIFSALAPDSRIIFLDLVNRVQAVSTADAANALMGDIGVQAKAKLAVAAKQAKETLDTIEQANQLRIKADEMVDPKDFNVTDALQKLSNDLPHKMKEILRWSKDYPNASSGSQSFF